MEITKKIIPNLGMIRDKTTGSLIIEFTVEFPKTLSEDIITIGSFTIKKCDLYL